MVDKNIFEMDALPSVADDTMIPVIATNSDASTNNKMSMTQVAQYIQNYIASLTRTVYVGNGVQYQYPNTSQAWAALGSPLNVVVCTDITEDADIKLNSTPSYLSITHASNVTVNMANFSFIAAEVPQITLKIDGGYAIYRRSYDSSKPLIDFNNAPQNTIIDIQNFVDDDQSDPGFSTPFIIQAPSAGVNSCYLKNVTLNLANNAISTNELYDASIENMNLVCNTGRDSDFILELDGACKINGLKAIGDFRATTTLMTVNKYSTYENVYNLASGQVAIVTSGGHGANLYGVNSLLNITMLGDEAAAISPKVVNANNCSFTFTDGVAENGAASITNADIMAVDNNGMTSGNFKFVNCQIPAQLNWVGSGEVIQFTSSNFQQGYSIESPNTVMVSTLAGLSIAGSSENIKVDGGDGSLILATQGNADFDDPTISTDDVEEGFNKVLT